MARVAGYALARLARCSCSPTLAARCSAFLRPALRRADAVVEAE